MIKAAIPAAPAIGPQNCIGINNNACWFRYTTGWPVIESNPGLGAFIRFPTIQITTAATISPTPVPTLA